jgi:ABC-type dipeptide/oligopeptide/nickel transport system permease component
MFSFILRRLATLPAQLIAVTLIVVILTQLIPPEQRARAFVKKKEDLQRLDQIIERHGLNKPFHVQYWSWLSEALRGNLGFSQLSGKTVVATFRERLPATLELSLFAFPPIIILGIWLGVSAALNKNRWLDKLLSFLAVSSYSLPTFVVAFYLLALFYGGFHILPGIGNISNENSLYLITGDIKRYTGLLSIDTLLSGQWAAFFDVLRHLFLPVTTMVIFSSAIIMQSVRSSLLETLNSDFVRTARAKGLSTRTVNFKHALRPALLTVVTLSVWQLGALLTGSIFVESIFGYPGVGQWGAQAASSADYPSLLGFTLFSAVVVILTNLLGDILYTVVDPRVRYD